MPYLVRSAMVALVLVSFLLTVPPDVFPGPGEMDPVRQSTFLMECADRMEKWFPLITIPSQELDLDRVKIVIKEDLVVVPLKKPHGRVSAIRWRQKEMANALDLIRLLRQGKIGAVNVLPLQHEPGTLYETDRNVLEELKGCQQKERLLEVFGECTECTVREWLDLKP